MPPSCGSSTGHRFRCWCRPCSSSHLTWTADALVRAERVGDPVLLFLGGTSRATRRSRAGDIDEMDRCIEIMGSLAEQLDQPILELDETFHLAKRAQIAGDTDRAEQLATEALQIGTDGGQPDAALFFGAQLMVVSAQRGTMGELVPLIEQMVAETSDDSRVARLRHWRWPTQKRDHTEEARQLLEEFAAADFDLPWTRRGSQEWSLLRRSRHRLPGPEVRRTAVRPARSVGRSVGRLPAVSRRQARSATTSVDSPPSSAATTRRTPTSLNLPP